MFKISFKISRFYLMFFVIERSVLCMLVQNNVNYKISLVSKLCTKNARTGKSA